MTSASKKGSVPFVAGGALLLGCAVLSMLSRRFPFGADPLKRPVLHLVALEAGMGAIYVTLVLWLQKKGTGVFSARAHPSGRDTVGTAGKRLPSPFSVLIVVGFLMRGALVPSTVILEDDVYRYLWDGAVAARGGNPYAFAPATVSGGEDARSGELLGELAAQAGEALGRISHPHLRTIYPPVTQAAFALAHVIRPFDVLGLRIVFLGFDVLLLVLLVRVLDALGKSRMWVVVYWWNPLVVAQVYNRCHMDVIPAALAVAALLSVIRRRHALGSVVLAFAAGAKLWPAALLPVFLREVSGRPKRLVLCAALFAGVLCAICLPMMLAGIDKSSGLYAYGERWSNNDSFHRIIVWGLETGLPAVGLPARAAPRVSRVIVAVAFLIVVVCVSRRGIDGADDLVRRASVVVAALFLLSPTQFPWYYIWLVPFLAFRPRPSLLLLTALLPLYYLRAWLEARGLFGRYENVVIAIEFVPVWVLLAGEWILARRARAMRLLEVSDQHA